MVSGFGRATSSGAFSINSADSGENGVSGDLHLDSGISTNGSSGDIMLRSGAAQKVPAAILVSLLELVGSATAGA